MNLYVPDAGRRVPDRMLKSYVKFADAEAGHRIAKTSFLVEPLCDVILVHTPARVVDDFETLQTSVGPPGFVF